MEKSSTCCFSGHRIIPAGIKPAVNARLNAEIDRLINLGVTDFISGGALGFDQTAASLIIMKRDEGADIRLIMALPCIGQEANWTKNQQQLYYKLLDRADEVIYVSEEYDKSCMKKRNYYMVDRSGYCICALLNERSGTAQTARYAMQKGLQVTNTLISSAD